MKDQLFVSIQRALLFAQHAFIRVPIFVQGDEAFVLSLLAKMEQSILVSDKTLTDNTLSWQHAKHWLGKELNTTIFDLRYEYDLNKLCALAGCIKGGNLAFFWLADDLTQKQNYFDKRLLSLIQKQNCFYISHTFGINIPHFQLEKKSTENTLPTKDQSIAIEAIEKVLYGHRRRPLFITADRGRGKSASLGIAASKILMAAKKHIFVTSMRFSNVETLFEHAALTCNPSENKPYELILPNGSRLTFIAIDRLLAEKPLCDLLLVDEAASIPLPMLNEIINNNSRVVFATTEHGYEGTGRGFSTKFRQLLDANVKNKHECKLNQPIRFAINCPLERWLYDAFLFDVEPVELQKGEVSFRQIMQNELIENEALLGQFFALLISAHYQTSPNDLKQILNNVGNVFIGAFCGENLIGILYAHKEGNFNPELKEQIAQGKRRVKGHLLAQSLAQHTGEEAILAITTLRIVRLAVLPNWQRKGIGSQLIKKVEANCIVNSMDMLGVSYAAEPSLVEFWLNQDFIPVRLGVQLDAASGNYSLQMLKALQNKPAWMKNLHEIFCQNFQYQLVDLYKNMNVIVAARLFSLSITPNKLSNLNLMQVKRFGDEQIGIEHIGASLYAWYCDWLYKSTNAALIGFSKPIEKLVFSRIVQRHSWNELVKEYGFSGRKETEKQIALWVKKQIDNSKE